MAIQVLMPALSPTMTEGTIANWMKTEGDKVVSGDVLCEIETDKATMEVEAVDEGVLGKILIAAGTESVAVNTPIAVILEEGEDISATDSFTTAPASAPEPASDALVRPRATVAPGRAAPGRMADTSPFISSMDRSSRRPTAMPASSGTRTTAPRASRSTRQPRSPWRGTPPSRT